MESLKTSALALLAIVLVLLFAAILLSIKSDKRRKSLAISAEGDGSKSIFKNEPQGKKPNLSGDSKLGTCFANNVSGICCSDGCGGHFNCHIQDT